MTNQELFVYQSPAEFEAIAKEIVATPTEESWPDVTITYPPTSGGCSFEQFTGPKDHVFAMVAFIVEHDIRTPNCEHMMDILDYATTSGSGDIATVILSKCHIPR